FRLRIRRLLLYSADRRLRNAMGPLNMGFFRRPFFWLALCVLISLAVLAYPLYVLRPFRPQGSRELTAALALMRFGPVLEIAFVIAALILLAFSWRQAHGRWRKVAT